MRILFFYSSAFELHVSAVTDMMKIGELAQWVSFHANLHVTYSFVYLTKWNPYALKSQENLIKIGPEHIMGLGLLSSAQGWERLHAYLKFMFPMLTSQREGAELKYLQCRELLHVTSAHKQYGVKSTNYKAHQSRHRFDCVCADGVKCVLCTLKEKWALPSSDTSTRSDDDADDEGGGGGGAATTKKRAGRRAAQPAGTRCSCGVVCESLTTARGLSREFPATALMMQIGRLCPSCCEVAEFIDNIGKPTPTGWPASTINAIGLKAKRISRRDKFDAVAEKRRKKLAPLEKQERE